MNCRVIKSRDCRVTQPFHYQNAYDAHGTWWDYYHGGVDLVRNYAQLDYIIAHTEGKVIGIETAYTGPVFDNSWGNYVWILHPNGYSTLYAHLAYNTIQVSLGQWVEEGQVLAYMDNTGPSTGGHLHFELRNPNNERIDGEPYLNAPLPGTRKWVQKPVWYLYDNNVMLTGWQKDDGKWYYLDKETGIMRTYWYYDKDYKGWFYLGEDGAMQVGWKEISGKWYYLSQVTQGEFSYGEMWRGWLSYGGKKYYLDPKDGYMYTGTHTIDGKSYTFDSSGALVS